MSRKPMVPVSGNARGMPGAKKPRIELTPKQQLALWREVQEADRWEKEERPNLEEVEENNRRVKLAAAVQLRTIAGKHEEEAGRRREKWAEGLKQAELDKDKQLGDRSGEWQVLLSDTKLNAEAEAAAEGLKRAEERLEQSKQELRKSEETLEAAHGAVSTENDGIRVELELIAAARRKRADAETRLKGAKDEAMSAQKEMSQEEAVTEQQRSALRKVMDEVHKCTEERERMQAEVNQMANFVRTFAWVQSDAASVDVSADGEGLNTSTIKVAQGGGKPMVFKVTGAVKGAFDLGEDLAGWCSGKQRGVILVSSDAPSALQDVLSSLSNRLARPLEVCAVEAHGDTHHDLLQADELHHADALACVPGMAPIELDQGTLTFPTATTAPLTPESLAAITKRLAARQTVNSAQCTAAVVTGKGAKVLVMQVPGTQVGAANQGFLALVGKLYSESKQARQNLRKVFGGRCLMHYVATGQIPVLVAAHVPQPTAVDCLRALQRVGMVDLAAAVKA